ncbi:hypothetical protein, partial [Candidatus Kurthia intestinigallinarum]
MSSLQRALHKKQQAKKIIQELQLIEKWSKIGTCHLVGAAAYDLIVSPDIDFETFCDEIHPDRIMQELAPLVANPNVMELKYHDYSKTDFNGHYFKLVYKEQDTEWTIDMWLFSTNKEGALSRDMVPLMKRLLTNSSRKIILDIKEALIERSLQFPSIFIYQAVLEYG